MAYDTSTFAAADLADTASLSRLHLSVLTPERVSKAVRSAGSRAKKVRVLAADPADAYEVPQPAVSNFKLGHLGHHADRDTAALAQIEAEVRQAADQGDLTGVALDAASKLVAMTTKRLKWLLAGHSSLVLDRKRVRLQSQLVIDKLAEQHQARLKAMAADLVVNSSPNPV